MNKKIGAIREKILSPEFEKWLSSKLAFCGRIIDVEWLSGGRSNSNFRVRTEHNEFLVRTQPPGSLQATAHDMGREFKVLSVLKDTDIPVPEVYLLGEDRSLLGVHFIVMSYIDGAIYQSFYLESETVERRRGIYFSMIDTLASLHEVNLAQSGLGEFGHKGNYFERQFHRWKKAGADMGRQSSSFNELVEWVGTHLPEDSTRCLIHGDYRLDNIIFDPSTPEVKAVIDWELSTTGDPMADLGYFLGIMDAPSDFIIPGFGDVDRSKAGIPEEDEMLERYCDLRGISRIDNWIFYKIFGFFRLAAICAGVARRAEQGMVPGIKAGLYADISHQLCEAGLKLRI